MDGPVLLQFFRPTGKFFPGGPAFSIDPFIEKCPFGAVLFQRPVKKLLTEPENCGILWLYQLY